MGSYTNGRFPLTMMVKLGDKHYLPAGTAARWRWLQRQAWEKYRVWLIITPGWNAYRPYNIQVEYREDLGIWAAVPGWSSHGLIYQGRSCAAIDVANWGDLGWARFKALCRLAGFTVDFVSPQELWHIGDFNDIWAVPAFAATPIKPVPAPAPEPELPPEEDDMPTVIKNPTSKEWSLLDPSIGLDLPQFVAGQQNRFRSEKTSKGVVNTYRGFMATTDPNIGDAWSRTHCRFYGNVPQERQPTDYRIAQNEASRLSVETHRA
ncbi:MULTISPECIES: hypothetical protein [unclassified Microbacterium]|uniref:hypothetical protein n=1 Tax=unclassified Microbacterium TaxID=2609290 RepID=UPI001604A9C9|nr:MULTISPECIES: hypothetical protein [unclassified Microbacterium]QNA93270.1 hypothetical protein G4G29_14795 [Microbacterium sp. Se63.02b]QYM63479.1 hypothetical protein K1X59_14845 [Microbacterium sp. Se5.02b]